MVTPGEHVRKRREQLGWSRETAGQRSGLGTSTIARTEAGHAAFPSTQRKISDAFQWRPDAWDRMAKGLDPELIDGTPVAGSYAELVAHVASLETAIERLAELIEQHIAAPQ